MASGRSSPPPAVTARPSNFEHQSTTPPQAQLSSTCEPGPSPSQLLDFSPDVSICPSDPVYNEVSSSNSTALWPQDLITYACNFKVSTQSSLREIQLGAIRTLLQKYGSDRVQTHQFQWMTYPSGSIADEWLPMYTYKVGISIWDIWEEWINGLDGHLSVRQLNDGWDARWRRNNSGQKTEAGRRKMVVKLIEALASKPNWNTQLALRFLKQKYPIPSSSRSYLKSTRAFIEHLQKKTTGREAFQAILLESSSYCT